MTDKQWAPEPWEYDDIMGMKDAKGYVVLLLEGFDEEDKADVHRIIVCVNACAGVPTEVLEHPNFHGMCKIVCEIAMAGKAAHEAQEATDE